MIAIVNIDPNPRESGLHLYSLRINQQEICQFTHKREDGLSTCLKRAADGYLASVVEKLMNYQASEGGKE